MSDPLTFVYVYPVSCRRYQINSDTQTNDCSRFKLTDLVSGHCDEFLPKKYSCPHTQVFNPAGSGYVVTAVQLVK